MKTKLLEWTLLFLLIGPAIAVLAQQTDADRFNAVKTKLEVLRELYQRTQVGGKAQFEAIKAKAEKGDAQSECDLGTVLTRGILV